MTVKHDGLGGPCPKCKKSWDWQHELLDECPDHVNRIGVIKRVFKFGMELVAVLAIVLAVLWLTP